MERDISGLVSILTSLGVLAIVTFLIYTNPYTPEGHEGYVFEQPLIYDSRK